MGNQTLAKRTRILFGLWCASFIFFDIGLSIYVSYQQVVKGIAPKSFLSGSQLATLGGVLFIFIPTLYVIYRSTKQYNSKKLKKVVHWLLLILSVWTGIMICCTVLELIVPGLLT